MQQSVDISLMQLVLIVQCCCKYNICISYSSVSCSAYHCVRSQHYCIVLMTLIVIVPDQAQVLDIMFDWLGLQ